MSAPIYAEEFQQGAFDKHSAQLQGSSPQFSKDLASAHVLELWSVDGACFSNLAPRSHILLPPSPP